MLTRALLLTALIVHAGCASRPAAPVQPTRLDDVAAYRTARERLIADDRAARLGAGLVLTAGEEAANRRLAAMKQAEFERTRGYFPPAHNFLAARTRQAMADSPLLEVMRRMPKGGVLHGHGSALGDFRWLVSEATYRDDCYVLVTESPGLASGTLRIADRSPGEGWRLVNDLRKAAPDAKAFDEDIFRSITLGDEEIGADDIWAEFGAIFRRVSGVIGHPEVNAAYWRKLLGNLIAENIQYVESRSQGIAQGLVRDARATDPDFDIKFIGAGGRSASRERIAQVLSATIDLRVAEPTRVVGFDLVEEEDRTNTNLHYIEELLAARREAELRGTTLPLYLHSGETSWAENENIYDAVLLGARRIGHALALIKHPHLIALVKERGIAIETNPISNQLLGYVPDLRNHPAVHYVNAGLPIVLSTDDPAIMQNTLSHEFYVAFMAWGLDLRGLKQIAMNSLLYSAMTPEERQQALTVWERRWQVFVGWLASNDR